MIDPAKHAAFDQLTEEVIELYPPFLKRLDPDYDFSFSMRYHIERQISPPAPIYPIAAPPIPVKVSFWDKIKQSLCAH